MPRPTATLTGSLALVAGSAVLPAAALHFLSREEAGFAPATHLVLVAVAALVAGSAATALTVVGVRTQDQRTVVVGAAFTTMTALLAVHGLATPGVLAGPNGVVAFAGGASLPVGGALLAFAAASRLQRRGAVRPLLVAQAVLTGGTLLLGALAFVWPSLVPQVPAPGSPLAVVVLVAGLAFFSSLAVRAARTFGLTRRRSDLLVAVGVTWMGLALFPTLLTDFTSLDFYLGHLLEVVGVGLVAVPLCLDLRRTESSRTVAGDFRAVDVVVHEEAFLGAEVRTLVLALEAKDPSTARHTRRVAERAVQVAEALGLGSAALRDLATAGLLHDVGKLSVPAAVLTKPGRLTDDEFDEIRRHPAAGDDLLRTLGGFTPAVRRIVRSHHERLDGAGYPDGLAASEIDLCTRVLTVCDVYDALVSERVYRRWPHSPYAAMDLLHRQAGTAFDPRCVEALHCVLRAEYGAAAREVEERLRRAMPAAARERATAAVA